MTAWQSYSSFNDFFFSVSFCGYTVFCSLVFPGLDLSSTLFTSTLGKFIFLSLCFDDNFKVIYFHR